MKWKNDAEKSWLKDEVCSWSFLRLLIVAVSFGGHVPSAHTLTLQHHSEHRDKTKVRGINPNFKSSAFRPTRINIVISPPSPFFPPVSAFYALPPLIPSIIRLIPPPTHSSSHSISVCLHLSFITHCLTIIHSAHSAPSLHILSLAAFCGFSL